MLARRTFDAELQKVGIALDASDAGAAALVASRRDKAVDTAAICNLQYCNLQSED